MMIGKTISHYRVLDKLGDGEGGVFYLAEGKPDEAVAFMEARDTMYTPALIYDEVGYYNMPPLQDVVARAYVALGDTARAIGEYEKLLAFDPSSADRRMLVPLYHYRVALLCEAEKRREAAAGHYERYLELMEKSDDGIEEVEDARRRLERIRRRSTTAGS